MCMGREGANAVIHVVDCVWYARAGLAAAEQRCPLPSSYFPQAILSAEATQRFDQWTERNL